MNTSRTGWLSPALMLVLVLCAAPVPARAADSKEPIASSAGQRDRMRKDVAQGKGAHVKAVNPDARPRRSAARARNFARLHQQEERASSIDPGRCLCTFCTGVGYIYGDSSLESKPCPECRGTTLARKRVPGAVCCMCKGKAEVYYVGPDDVQGFNITCPNCNGTGRE